MKTDRPHVRETAREKVSLSKHAQTCFVEGMAKASATVYHDVAARRVVLPMTSVPSAQVTLQSRGNC